MSDSTSKLAEKKKVVETQNDSTPINPKASTSISSSVTSAAPVETPKKPLKELKAADCVLLVRMWGCHELVPCFAAEGSLSSGGLALFYIDKESDVMDVARGMKNFKVRLLLDMLAHARQHGVDMEALQNFMKEQDYRKEQKLVPAFVPNFFHGGRENGVTSAGYTFTSNEHFRKSVTLWCSDRAAAEKLFGPIGGWDTGQITDMSGLFKGQASFNDDISHWDTSGVADMSCMFQGAKAFNQPVGSWNVSHVANMDSMFSQASAFNQPLAAWSTANVANMHRVFCGAAAFNQPLEKWSVGRATKMSSMFAGAAAFNQPLGPWDVSKATSMFGMFYEAKAFNQPLDAWDVGHVTDMSAMFQGALLFNQSLAKWNISRVNAFHGMFRGAKAFNHSLEAWVVSKHADTEGMFLDSAYTHKQPQKEK